MILCVYTYYRLFQRYSLLLLCSSLLPRNSSQIPVDAKSERCERSTVRCCVVAQTLELASSPSTEIWKPQWNQPGAIEFWPEIPVTSACNPINMEWNLQSNRNHQSFHHSQLVSTAIPFVTALQFVNAHGSNAWWLVP